MKWENFCKKKVTGGKSFVFFFDEDKLKICKQKKGAKVFSEGDLLCSFDFDNDTFSVFIDKESYACIHKSGEYNFPAETDMNKQDEYLYISGSGKAKFISEIFEVFGIDI